MIEKTLKNLIKDPLNYPKLVGKGLIVGLFAGIVVTFYRFLLDKSEDLLFNILNIIHSNIYLICLWFIILLILGLITGFLIKWEPMAAGSGIPQVEAEVKGYLNLKWWKIIIIKFIGGTLSTFGGLSLGREGPSVQLGAMASKGASKLLNVSRTDQHKFLISGSAAGLAATFNAPLTGLLFALEEINRSIDRNLLIIGFVAVLTADIVSKCVFGMGTVFSFKSIAIPLRYYWLFIILGLVVGICGYIYNITMIKANDAWSKINKIPREYRITIAFLISGIVGLYIPEVLSGGFAMASILEVAIPTLSVVLILLIVKFLFSTLCFSTGAPGGIFYPLLVLGAYIGAAFGLIFVPYLGLDSKIIYDFIIIAMAGFFASTIRAPITGIVLTVEMTGSAECILAMIIVTVIAYIIPTILGNKPIYTSLVERVLKNNNLEDTNAKKTHVLAEYVVPIDCKYIDCKIKDIPFPKNCIVTSINRGADSLLATEDLTLKFSDQVFILMDSESYSDKNKQIEFLIYKKKL